MADTDIAVVGIACRLPGARNPAEFWQLLAEGRCARVEFTDAQLRAAGADERALRDPAYVKAGMVLADIDRFDAGFFALSPRDAAIMDPQHRVFLEVCWEALEDGGHVPDSFDGRIGVFAGCGMDTYLLHNVLSNPQLVADVGMFLIRHGGNDKDFLATRVSYQFDLRGPSVNVLTACSTSLVAIHQAAQSLLAGECDLALAGGVTILVPQDRGYRYQPGEILSPDGHCRAFDAASKGTVFGSGAGVVVLRRLDAALAAGDHVHAVIAGSAVNNDGARKVGFLAPSVDGYAEVVAEALTLADASADQVQYIEAHGTGTPVGDPIEIEALTQAFRVSTERKGFCGIGSVKTNIGHLDTAAGIAGLLKVVLAMQHGQLPPSLLFATPNPLIDFGNSPFRVVAAATEWPEPAGGLRLAGVSSLGVGGTNAHVVVRQAPAPTLAEPAYARRYHLLPVAARSADAVVAYGQRLADHLDQCGDEELPGIAATLQTGRKAFAFRAFAVGATTTELCPDLAAGLATRVQKAADRPGAVVFLFPGGGAQHPGMGRGLYDHEPVYRAAADECLQALPDDVAQPLRALLFGDRSLPAHGAELERPSYALPALFCTEYALARTLMALGIEPEAMLGHSMGEYVAACIAGVFDAAAGMRLVLLRGRLFETVPPGAMLSVPLPAQELDGIDGKELSLAAANAPELSAVGGTVEAIERLQAQLQQRGVDSQRLRIHVAAHSHLLDPILDEFRQGLRDIPLRPAERPFVSNVTGDWIEPARAADPEYWVQHLRDTVRFQDGVATLLQGGDRVFVEVGPGRALVTLVRLHPGAQRSQCATALPHAQESVPADRALLECMGRLWQHGVAPDWRALQGGPRRRVRLPTYVFQRQRHWIEPGRPLREERTAGGPATVPARLPERQWLAVPHYEACELAATAAAPAGLRWLVIGRGGPLQHVVTAAITAGGGSVTVAVPGAAFAVNSDHHCTFAPRDPVAVARMLAHGSRGGAPQRVLFLLAADGVEPVTLTTTLLHLQQALGSSSADDGVRLLALTVDALAVDGAPQAPEQAVVHGFLGVVPTEYPGVTARALDVDSAALADEVLAAHLLREIEADGSMVAVALRRGRRFERTFVAPGEAPAAPPAGLRQGGVYLITGGLGGLGAVVARHLATNVQARLVLVSRSGLPPREAWDEWLLVRGEDRTGALIRRVRELEELGAEVLVAAADVADVTAMADVIARTRARFGALHGVFHAAGILDDGPIQLRKETQVAAMLRPKITGALVLDAATQGSPPELMVLFASTSGLCGIPGQCDYAAGNSFLDAFAAWRNSHRPGRTLAIDWGIWQQVGMVAGGQAPLGVTGNGRAAPWLGDRRERDQGIEFASTWTQVTHWQLAEHRLADGRAVLPGTAHLELCLGAARAASGVDDGLELLQVELRAPMVFAADETRRVYVTVQRGAQGALDLRVESAPADGRERVEHARATARRAAVASSLAHVDAWWHEARGAVPLVSTQRQFVEFGPRWDSLQQSGYGQRTAVATLHLADAYHDDLRLHALHPALVDAAIAAAVPLLPGADGDLLYAPVGCRALRAARAVPADVVVRARLVDFDEHSRLATIDLELATPGGVPVVEIDGLALLGMQGGFAAAAVPVPAAGANARTAARAAADGTPPRLRQLLDAGIAPAEGMAALQQALATGEAQVVVSSMPMAEVAQWLAAPTAPVRAPAFAAEPAAAAAGADAPRDDVERRLAAWFRELLGLERVGLDQDFFELGGHSLLAVRLFARIHKEHGVDLQLATLLSAATVRALAVVLREQLGWQAPQAPSAAPASAAAVTEPAPVHAVRGDYLVPIQPKGDRPILFLVHGAGGNVLGFRDLAHYLGPDQPVYGLQARGVDGKQTPHARIEDMANAYLAEIVQAQPQGPYYLGGYSGGGCVAFEMAQQLCARGEPVAFVGMVDTPTPHMKERSLVARGAIHLKRLWQRGPLYPVRMLKHKFEQRRTTQQHRGLAARGQVLPMELRGAQLQHAFDAAFFRYQCKPYDGRLWLFRAESESRTKYVRDRTLGWEPFPRGGMVAVECPGDHFSMCADPHIQTLCAEIRAAMDDAIAAVVEPAAAG